MLQLVSTIAEVTNTLNEYNLINIFLIVLEMFSKNCLLLFYLTIQLKYYLNLSETKCNETIDKPVINIGFLGSFKYGLTLGKLIAGAIPLAIDQINKYLL